MILIPAMLPAATPATRNASCHQIVLTGEVTAHQQWSAPIGQDWNFRLVPVQSSDPSKQYSGWDLVVDHANALGYPDALLLATPPYASLNEREIATTFGLRAQDAIAWQPRHFRFLISEQSLSRARSLFQQLNRPTSKSSSQSTELLHLIDSAATGEFTITDARLIPGIADPPAFAQQWAAHLSQVPHQLASSKAPPTPRGELQWMRFTVTLLLPSPWRTVPGTVSTPAKCAQ
jgi:hypothetical protein